MKSFSLEIHVKQKHNFPEYKYNKVLKRLRQSLNDHIIGYRYEIESKKETFDCENNSFDLELFFKTNGIVLSKDKERMYETVKSELLKLGWNCDLTFGGTTLFIYSSNKLPTSCWTDGF
jgi:hypothetical protein